MGNKLGEKKGKDTILNVEGKETTDASLHAPSVTHAHPMTIRSQADNLKPHILVATINDSKVPAYITQAQKHAH